MKINKYRIKDKTTGKQYEYDPYIGVIIVRCNNGPWSYKRFCVKKEQWIIFKNKIQNKNNK